MRRWLASPQRAGGVVFCDPGRSRRRSSYRRLGVLGAMTGPRVPTVTHDIVRVGPRERDSRRCGRSSRDARRISERRKKRA